MSANPYKSSADTHVQVASRSPHRQRFPFWRVGPLTGAAIGLVYVLAMAAAWAAHGYPDFLLRSAESAILFAVVMSFGGAMFGVPYACVVGICVRSFGLAVRPRLHFFIGTIASFVVTYVAADISLRRRELASPFLDLAVIIGFIFVGALLSARRGSVTD